MAAVTYSIWANAPADHPGVKDTAQHLRQIYGGPEFDAHVTVLGSFSLPPDEAKARLQTLCRSIPPVTYKLTGVSHGPSYFQCVYLTVDPSPQVRIISTFSHKPVMSPSVEKMVTDVNRKAQEIFDHKTEGYMPHLSLLYGDLKDEDKESAKAVVEEKYGNLLNMSEFVHGLPTMDRVAKWGRANDTCCRCRAGAESMDHLITDCCIANENGTIGSKKTQGTFLHLAETGDFFQIMDDAWKGKSWTKIILCVKTLWGIWFERNAARYSEKNLSIPIKVAALQTKEIIQARLDQVKSNSVRARKLETELNTLIRIFNLNTQDSENIHSIDNEQTDEPPITEERNVA
ncbi:hypothetical protein R1sor_021363 [Riccia sorocarpa]|uniref:Cyclic phosphodiesterase n=1 Tax=Riccia sorocarpa TaxID=122646 RepID=A0ABD3GGV1_9MARC